MANIDLTGFVEFTGLTEIRTVDYPRVSVQRRGKITLNPSALEVLGKPERVSFMRNPNTGKIALRAAAADAPHAATLKPAGRGLSASVAAKAFLDIAGVPLTEPFVFNEVQAGDGVLVLDPAKRTPTPRARIRRSPGRPRNRTTHAEADGAATGASSR